MQMTKDIRLSIILVCISTGFLIILPSQVQTDVQELLSPATFPILALGAIIGLSVILMIQNIISQKINNRPEVQDTLKSLFNSKVIASFLSLIVYIFIMKKIGYFLTTLTVLIFYTKYLGCEKYKTTVIFAVVLTVLLYIIFFKVLHVPLPKGIIFEY